MRRFLGDQAISLLTTVLSIVFTTCFYFLARWLTPEQFGELNAYIAFAYLFFIGQSSLINQILLFHQEGLRGPVLRRAAVKRGLLLSAATIIVIVVASPFLASFFHLPITTGLLVLGMSSVFFYGAAIVHGLLLAERRIASAGLVGILESGAKFAVGVALFANGYDSWDAPQLIFLYSGIAFGSAVLLLRGRQSAEKGATTAKTTHSSLMTILAMNAILTLLIKADVLWGKHALPPDQAGHLAAISTMASLLFFIAGGIRTAASAYMSRDSAHRVFLWSCGIFVAGCVAAVTLFHMWGPTLVGYFFGTQYLPYSWLVLPLFIAVTGYGFVTFSAHSLTILGFRAPVVLSAVLLFTQIAGFWLYGNTIQGIVVVQTIVMSVFGILFASIFWAASRRGLNARSLDHTHVAAHSRTTI